MLPYYLLVFQFLEYRIFFIYPKFDIQRFFFLTNIFHDVPSSILTLNTKLYTDTNKTTVSASEERHKQHISKIWVVGDAYLKTALYYIRLNSS